MIGLLVIAAIIISLGVIAIYRLVEKTKDKRNLHHSGITTSGTVIHRRSTTSSGRGRWRSEYYILYQFEARQPNGEAQILLQEQLVNRWQYERLKPGSSIQVQYLPTNPKQATILK